MQKKRRILLGAHYDTRFKADKDKNRPFTASLGANDGASGVSVLLEIAENLRLEEPSSYGVDIVFFDLEDQGDYSSAQNWSLGAKYFVNNNSGDIWEKIVVVDMVADKDLNIYKEGFSHNNSSDLVDTIWQLSGNKFIDSVKYFMTDDHLPFIQNGMNAALIIDFDYKYWHSTLDIPENCSPESLEIVGKVLLKLIYEY